MSRQLLSRARIATCTLPGPGHTVISDYGTYVVLDPDGAIVHRYATERVAITGRDLHNHPDACHACLHGCECKPGQTGCAHYGCWAATGAFAGTCAFASVIRAATLQER